MAIPFMVYNQATAIASSTGDQTTSPASALLSNQPTLAWRSTAAGNVALVFQLPAAAPIDTLALLYSNLRNTDTVRWRAGTTAANTTAAPLFDSNALAAYSGVKSPQYRTKSITTMASPVTAQFWRLDIAAPSHPAGYVTATNVVIGQRLNLGGQYGGIDWGLNQTWTGQSNISTTNGYTSVQPFMSLPGWKLTSSWITEADWNTNFVPFFQTVGDFTPVLTVPDPASGYLQHQAVYGRITSNLTGSTASVDAWTVDMAVTGLTV